MRSGRTQLRGEAGRVAERVRVVIAANRGEDDLPRPVADHPDTADDSGGRVLARLSERLPVRVDPGRRPALAIGVVVVLAAIVTGLWVMSSRPRSMPVSASAPPLAGASPLVSSSASAASAGQSRGAASSARSSPATAEVVVDVAGKVRRPGLYRLPPGSRVDDALTAAGGALRGVDLTSLNLAALVTDGQQIAVGRPGAAAPPASGAAGGGASAGGAGAAGGLVNLNTATLEQLEALPGIGPALGQRILDYRTEHGSFGSVDQLDDVSGIGTVTFQRLKPLVTV